MQMDFTKYISPDGLEYNFDDGLRWLMSEEGYGMPEIDYITQKGPFQHGETVIDYRLKPRIIQLQLRQDSCDRWTYWEERALLIDMLRPNRNLYGQRNPGTLRKELPDGSQFDLKVVLEQGPVFQGRDIKRWDEWGYTETIRFIAHDPVFYNPVLQTVTYVLATQNHLIFPFVFIPNPGTDLVFATDVLYGTTSIPYPGTWMSFPTIQLTGPLNGPDIQNLSTGERIKMNYNIAPGEQVTITLDYGNKQVYNSVGTNLIGTISTDSDFATFHIAPDPEVPNGTNVVSVLGGGAIVGTTVICFNYYERYIGI